jgi:YfiH family protein
LAESFLTRYSAERSGSGHASFLQCAAFLDFEWLDHAFGTRHSTGYLHSHRAITLRQIHSNHVLRVNGFSDRQCEGDALLTDEIGQRIGVRSADCVPLLIADPRTNAVAAVHAGWRGTAAAIAAKAIGRMVEEFGSDPLELHVAIGPAIRECCYEVGPEVVAQLAVLFPEWRAEKSTRRQVNLVEANRRTLEQAGVPRAQIYDSGICTKCTPELFHSYRRDPRDPGRMVSSILRKERLSVGNCRQESGIMRGESISCDPGSTGPVNRTL